MTTILPNFKRGLRGSCYCECMTSNWRYVLFAANMKSALNHSVALISTGGDSRFI